MAKLSPITVPVIVQRTSVVAFSVSKRDTHRLSPWLSGWTRLNRLLTAKSCQPTRDDLSKLLRLELEGKRRRAVMERLVGRILSMDREQTWKLIDAISKTCEAAGDTRRA